MLHVLKELEDGLKYHYKQLEENERKIEYNLQTNLDLEARNARHREAISELTDYIATIKQDS